MDLSTLTEPLSLAERAGELIADLVHVFGGVVEDLWWHDPLHDHELTRITGLAEYRYGDMFERAPVSVTFSADARVCLHGTVHLPPFGAITVTVPTEVDLRTISAALRGVSEFVLLAKLSGWTIPAPDVLPMIRALSPSLIEGALQRIVVSRYEWGIDTLSKAVIWTVGAGLAEHVFAVDTYTV
ncbi:hypothetical protein HGA91_06360 [candidate division WWE3 bacterium]|nr:hypothetical protein [candidate division WWE3 bacterium]